MSGDTAGTMGARKGEGDSNAKAVKRKPSPQRTHSNHPDMVVRQLAQPQKRRQGMMKAHSHGWTDLDIITTNTLNHRKQRFHRQR